MSETVGTTAVPAERLGRNAALQRGISGSAIVADSHSQLVRVQAAASEGARVRLVCSSANGACAENLIPQVGVAVFRFRLSMAA
jgi:hypothetical protein